MSATVAMIVSLGGSPEPLAKAISTHRPQFVCYLASQQSIYLLGTVQNLLKEAGVELGDTKVVLVDDAEDLTDCFEKALECGRILEAHNVSPDQVVVDYTGGTKNMTAALALTTARKGYSFSYVGGTSRTKEGLGTVQTGFEMVHTGISPWQIFAVEEWQHLVLLIEYYQYEAALNLIKETLPRQPRSEHLRWRGLQSVVSGLQRWDHFNHKDALDQIREGYNTLEEWIQIKKDKRLGAFVRQGRESLRFLQEMASATQGFQKPARHMLIDILANAERRAAQGRYDDAVARLYRALEMQGQLAFLERTGASTSDVRETCLPVGLREEFVERYQDPLTGKIQLPLFPTFRVLQALDDPTGKVFFDEEERFAKILSARNQSILAHGIQSVSKSTFEGFLGLLRSTFDLNETVNFPKLDLPF